MSTAVLSSLRPGCIFQGDHLSGKPGDVGEFGTCQGNVRDVGNSQRNVREKNLVMERCPKTVHY